MINLMSLQERIRRWKQRLHKHHAFFCIVYNNPKFGQHITFVERGHIEWTDDRTLNEMRDQLREAYAKYHPTWMIKNVILRGEP